MGCIRLQRCRKSEEEQRSSQHQNQLPLKKWQMGWFWCEADVDCRRGRRQIHLKPSRECRRTSWEPQTAFPLNLFLMAVLNYSVFLASDLFCCLLTTPFEEKPFTFLLYIAFEENISYRVYSRVNNSQTYFEIMIIRWRKVRQFSTFFPALFFQQFSFENNQYVVLNIRDIYNMSTTFFFGSFLTEQR